MNNRIDSFLIEAGFTKCVYEQGVYVNNANKVSRIIVCLYIDDLMITCVYKVELRKVKTKLMQEFEMYDLWNFSYLLGMEFKDTGEGVVTHQKKYAKDIFKRFMMSNCNAVATPFETGLKLRKETNDEFVSATLYKQIIGPLRYLCNNRPYIYQSVGLLSRFMEKPKKCHFTAIKRVLRYIK